MTEPHMVWWLCPACAEVQEHGDVGQVEPPELRPYVLHFLRTRGRLVPGGMTDSPQPWRCDCCDEPQRETITPSRFT